MAGPVTPKFDKAKQKRFIEEFTKTHLMVKSAEYAGVSYNTVKAELDKNPEFAEEFELAKKKHLEWIDEEIKMRATGYEEELTFQGQTTGDTRTVFNPRLLELYAKRRNPEYAERQQVEQTTTHKGEVAVTHRIDVKSLSAEQRDAMKTLLGDGDAGSN